MLFQKDVKDSVFKTSEGEEPKIIFTMDENEIRSSVIVGDGTQVCLVETARSTTGIVCKSLYLLLGIYFVLHLEYPKDFAPILNLLQEKCLCQPVVTSKKTTAYKAFVATLV